MVFADDNGDGFEEEALPIGAGGAHLAPLNDRRRRGVQGVPVLVGEAREALLEAREPELFDLSRELSLEKGEDIVDRRELIDVREGRDGLNAERIDAF